MEKVFVIIAENGERGIWSVSSYKTLEAARSNMDIIAQRVEDDLRNWDEDTLITEYRVNSPGDSGLVTNGNVNITIEIHETILK